MLTDSFFSEELSKLRKMNDRRAKEKEFMSQLNSLTISQSKEKRKGKAYSRAQ